MLQHAWRGAPIIHETISISSYIYTYFEQKQILPKIEALIICSSNDGIEVGKAKGDAGLQENIPYSWMSELSVISEYRKCGVGREMFVEICNTFRSHGYKSMRWCVESDRRQFDTASLTNIYLKFGARVLSNIEKKKSQRLSTIMEYDLFTNHL